jgi:hypothetical protein
MSLYNEEKEEENRATRKRILRLIQALIYLMVEEGKRTFNVK